MRKRRDVSNTVNNKIRQFIFTHLYNSNLDAVGEWIDNSVG